MSARESPKGNATSKLITISNGRTLPMTVSAYETVRRPARGSTVTTICNAPFVSLDFGTRGAVGVCNHIFEQLTHISPDTGILQIWNGPEISRLRTNFQEYCLDTGCVHCIHQIETGHARETFAQQHFDQHSATAQPQYPKRLILRLNSTCNLACIMCDGETSSRIRKERDRLPAYPSAYGEPFFRDIERILPHLEYVEFYGGEPFLVAEHLRIMDMMVTMNAKAKVFANTNCVAFSPNAKRFVDKLNFHTIAVSMDGYHAEVHEAVRIGIKHSEFMENLDWLMSVGQRRGFDVYLNVTEHRKNWFDLPELFRFADSKRLAIHVNHCIAPDNVTLYTLADDELEYILGHWQTEQKSIYGSGSQGLNRESYSHLISLISGELRRRAAGGVNFTSWVNPASDGKLALPIAGLAPFDTPKRVRAEAERIGRLAPSRAISMLTELTDGIEARIDRLSPRPEWEGVQEFCRRTVESLSAGTGRANEHYGR